MFIIAGWFVLGGVAWFRDAGLMAAISAHRLEEWPVSLIGLGLTCGLSCGAGQYQWSISRWRNPRARSRQYRKTLPMRCVTAPPSRSESRGSLWRMTAHCQEAVRLKRAIAARGLASLTSIAGWIRSQPPRPGPISRTRRDACGSWLAYRRWYAVSFLIGGEGWVRDRCPIERLPRDHPASCRLCCGTSDGRRAGAQARAARGLYRIRLRANFISCLRRMARRGSGSHGTSCANSRRSITGRCSGMLALPPIRPAGTRLP